MIERPPSLISVVVPVRDEAPALRELADEISLALGKTDYELLFVDDGSTDDSAAILTDLAADRSAIRPIFLGAHGGKGAALSAGFARARGDVIVTLDGDLQDDARDIPAMLELLARGADLVVGWKHPRRDPASRRILSFVFNTTVALSTGVRLHDMNCGLKAVRRDVLDAVPMDGELYRFFAVFAARAGYVVMEHQTAHRPRRYGASRYGWERIPRGAADLARVLLMVRKEREPVAIPPARPPVRART